MFKFLASVALLAALVPAVPVARRKNQDFPFVPRLPGRIIDGEETTIEDNPHQISVQYDDFGHICGGSIISKNWILTAAHCSYFGEMIYYSVLAGTANRFAAGSRRRVIEMFAHEEFYINSFETMVNDLALIRVDVPFEFSTKIKSISLYGVDEETRVGSIASVTGWGTTKNGQTAILNIVEIPIISKALCNKLYRERGGLPAGQICAAYEKGGKDACQGDSGGPLIVNGRLAGIVSWGDECAVEGKPGVYTEIAHFRDWIGKHSDI